jgi:hypothetical protein
MTAGPRAPGVAPRVNQPATGGGGVSISPFGSSPSLTNFDWTPIFGIDRATGSDSGSTKPVILSRTSLRSAGAVGGSGFGFGASGEADDRLSAVGAPPTADSDVDGLVSAAHTSTAPMMANPTAIQTRPNRLVRQRDELITCFDPPVDRASTQHPEANPIRCSVPKSQMPSSWFQASERLNPAQRRATLCAREEALTPSRKCRGTQTRNIN